LDASGLLSDWEEDLDLGEGVEVGEEVPEDSFVSPKSRTIPALARISS